MDVEKTKLLDDLMADYLTVSYSGAFDGAVLTAFANKVENNLSSDLRLNKKIFKIFVELAQNIALYASDKVVTDDHSNFNGFGTFLIKEFPDKFQLISGNMAFKKDAKIATDKCDMISGMTRDNLREFKRELRKKPAGQKGGGNIGLIQIVLTANNEIDYQVIEVDRLHSFVIFSIDISKDSSKKIN